MDRDQFRQLLRSSPLHGDLSSLCDRSPDDLFDLYDSVLRVIINAVLPVRNVKCRFQPNAPWFDKSCRERRRTARRLEKRYRRSGEAADRTIWSNFLREMHRGFKERECSYWEEKISEQSDNPKKRWKNISTVLGKKPTSKHLPAFSPDAYLSFLEEKVKKVYDDTSGAAHPTYTGCITSFGELEVCPVEELERTIKSAPCKSCELDPVPTFLLLECLEILLPFIHIM